MPPLLNSDDFSFPADVVDRSFSPCIHQPGQAEPFSQVNVENISSTEQYWKNLADHNEKALGDALVENNQVWKNKCVKTSVQYVWLLSSRLQFV